MRRALLKTALVGAASIVAIGLAAGSAQAQTVASVGGQIYSMGPAGEIASGTVVIRDGKIVAVGANVAVPAGAQVIDAHGAVVTPGLIAADAGVGATEVGEDTDAGELGANTAGPGAGTRAGRGH